MKSTALLFGDKTKYLLSVFSAAMVTNLALAGMAADQSWPYFAGIGITTAHLTWQVRCDCKPDFWKLHIRAIYTRPNKPWLT